MRDHQIHGSDNCQQGNGDKRRKYGQGSDYLMAGTGIVNVETALQGAVAVIDMFFSMPELAP